MYAYFLFKNVGFLYSVEVYQTKLNEATSKFSVSDLCLEELSLLIIKDLQISTCQSILSK